ncbi:hypothetical protein Sjap_023481 [Stephania japonica]|uniref:Protein DETOXIFICATION n=1 Tax=Stephania japonica TaxID=461633 RepID=A0AAP0EBQ4_9MAGN
MSSKIITLRKPLLSNRDPKVEEDSKPGAVTAPAIFTNISRYSLIVVTQAFAGHLGNLELAAVSIVNSVISGFTMGIALGMGSALETLCGQAYGAGQLDMLGVYLQRSWVIVNTTGLILSPLYIFAKPLLMLIGQKQDIADAAGTFAIWTLPQWFAYTMNFPVVKFLQAQQKMMIVAVVAAVALGLHTLFSWVLMFKLKWGLVGAAVAISVVQCSSSAGVYIFLEVRYYRTLILIAGYLKNPEISVDALSICLNISGWTLMLAFGYQAATRFASKTLHALFSSSVSNELGAGHPRTAKFSIAVVVINSFLIGLVLAPLLVIFQQEYPKAFTNSEVVTKFVSNLTPLLAFSVVINSVQPVLTGAATGAGWQALVAYVNIGCYYVFGIPLGLLLAYKFNYGIQGIWLGMISGTVAQTCILLILTYRTNWDKEASVAEDRIRTWGGEPNGEETMNE